MANHRINIGDKERDALERIAEATGYPNISAAGCLLINRYADKFLEWWVAEAGNAPSNPPEPEPVPTTAPKPKRKPTIPEPINL